MEEVVSMKDLEIRRTIQTPKGGFDIDDMVEVTYAVRSGNERVTGRISNISEVAVYIDCSTVYRSNIKFIELQDVVSIHKLKEP